MDRAGVISPLRDIVKSRIYMQEYLSLLQLIVSEFVNRGKRS